ncbi:zinc finger cchc domain containing 8 [Holotrichia oblita]|uniref:Zinc finger cchc domain containing 8 n=1 Tax=Holotrichia oblita TaxID=644536 RepID=A0ACB9T611_HOLOL|nr:zinc finger cchc domain containing 8 [Holotrichia oblita]
MADVNNGLGKRKTLDSAIIFELDDEKDIPPDSPQNGALEPVPKVIRKDDIVDSSEGNLYQELSQTSVETNISMIEKLTELQEENMKLKRQLEIFSNKVCKCSLNVSTGSEESNHSKSTDNLITIKFHDEIAAEEYKHKFVKLLKSFIELTCTEDKLNINIIRKGNDDTDLMSPSKKRKRKKSKSKSKDLFVVDTTPSVARNDNMLKYVSKYLVTTPNELNDKDTNNIQKCSPVTCFNCNQNHSLRECPVPKNFAKINAARNQLKQQAVKMRYHTDEEQKYSHFKPGVISADLKKALGVRSNEYPSYIYRMRCIGYPPGWMEDAQVTQSNISMYGIDGKELSMKNNKGSIDPDKVIEYPGFNMPLESGVWDDYKLYCCPPYSEKYSKTSMLQFINDKFQKEQDDLEACDMDLDQSSDETFPPGCEPKSKIETVERLSPSLIYLEQKKMELLAELGENNTTSTTADEKTDQVEASLVDEEENIPANNLNDSIEFEHTDFVVVDDSQGDVTSQNDESKCDKNDETIDCAQEETQNSKNLTKSTFGTPIVKSASPYNRLPNAENFSKDISPVINFENLPNSTGKYEQMTCILQKIRRTLKSTTEKL